MLVFVTNDTTVVPAGKFAPETSWPTLTPAVDVVVNTFELVVDVPVRVVPVGHETATPLMLELAFCDITTQGVVPQPEFTAVMVVLAGILRPIIGKPTTSPVLLVRELMVLPLVVPVAAPYLSKIVARFAVQLPLLGQVLSSAKNVD
jgi:hypothetical protein